MARTVYRITPTGNGSWSVKRDGAERADSVHQNKDDAIKRGRELAIANQPSQLVIHGLDGKIQTEYTYGNDPRRYPG